MCAFEQIIQQRFHLTFLVFNEDFHSMSCLHRPFNKGFVSFNKDVLFCTEQPLKVSYHFFFCTKQPSKVSYHSTKMSSFARSNQERFHISPQKCPTLHRTTKKGFISFNKDVLFCTELPRKVSCHSTKMSCFVQSNQQRFHTIQQRCPFLHRAVEKGFMLQTQCI